MKHLLLHLIRGYQIAISPMLGLRCRFYPSCSEYTKQSIAKHGVIKGLIHGFLRLAKCHPFHAGGHDPVQCNKR